MRNRERVRQIEETVEAILEGLIDYPDEMEIKTLEGETIVVFEVFMRQSDIGKVIGRRGRTIKAIRVVLEGASAKDRINYVLQVVEA